MEDPQPGCLQGHPATARGHSACLPPHGSAGGRRGVRRRGGQADLGPASTFVTERHYIDRKMKVNDYRAATERLAPDPARETDAESGEQRRPEGQTGAAWLPSRIRLRPAQSPAAPLTRPRSTWNQQRLVPQSAPKARHSAGRQRPTASSRTASPQVRDGASPAARRTRRDASSGRGRRRGGW